MINSVLTSRLRNQRIAEPRGTSPGAVVRWFGAMQAQDFGAAMWAVGLRIRGGSTAAAVEEAFNRGEILRTHLMRPTWHFVSPQDIRWMLDLTGPRVRRAITGYNQRLGLDGAELTRATRLIERSLRDQAFLTRAELGEQLRESGMIFNGAQLTQVAMNAELEGVICSGPRNGKQFTYALLAERASSAAVLQRDEGLCTLARLFLRSHGPATVRDFAWWSGLTVQDAKRGFQMNRARDREFDGGVYWSIGVGHHTSANDEVPDGVALLPVYDEFSVAYRDRAADPATTVGAPTVVTAMGTVGTWRVAREAGGLRVSVALRKAFTKSDKEYLRRAVHRYTSFRGLPCRLSVSRESASARRAGGARVG